MPLPIQDPLKLPGNPEWEDLSVEEKHKYLNRLYEENAEMRDLTPDERIQLRSYVIHGTKNLQIPQDATPDVQQNIQQYKEWMVFNENRLPHIARGNQMLKDQEKPLLNVEPSLPYKVGRVGLSFLSGFGGAASGLGEGARMAGEEIVARPLRGGVGSHAGMLMQPGDIIQTPLDMQRAAQGLSVPQMVPGQGGMRAVAPGTIPPPLGKAIEELAKPTLPGQSVNEFQDAMELAREGLQRQETTLRPELKMSDIYKRPANLVASLAEEAGPTVAMMGPAILAQKYLGNIAAGIVNRAIEGAIESNQAYRSARAAGKDEEEARRIAEKVGIYNLPLAAFDAAELAIIFSPLPKWAARPLSKLGANTALAAKIGLGTAKAAVVGLQEGGEEILQQRIQEVAANPTKGFSWNPFPQTPEENTAFTLGAYNGIIMGAAGSAPGAYQALADHAMQRTIEKGNAIVLGSQQAVTPQGVMEAIGQKAGKYVSIPGVTPEQVVPQAPAAPAPTAPVAPATMPEKVSDIEAWAKKLKEELGDDEQTPARLIEKISDLAAATAKAREALPQPDVLAGPGLALQERQAVEDPEFRNAVDITLQSQRKGKITESILAVKMGVKPTQARELLGRMTQMGIVGVREPGGAHQVIGSAIPNLKTQAERGPAPVQPLMEQAAKMPGAPKALPPAPRLETTPPTEPGQFSPEVDVLASNAPGWMPDIDRYGWASGRITDHEVAVNSVRRGPTYETARQQLDLARQAAAETLRTQQATAAAKGVQRQVGKNKLPSSRMRSKQAQISMAREGAVANIAPEAQQAPKAPPIPARPSAAAAPQAQPQQVLAPPAPAPAPTGPTPRTVSPTLGSHAKARTVGRQFQTLEDPAPGWAVASEAELDGGVRNGTAKVVYLSGRTRILKGTTFAETVDHKTNRPTGEVFAKNERGQRGLYVPSTPEGIEIARDLGAKQKEIEGQDILSFQYRDKFATPRQAQPAAAPAAPTPAAPPGPAGVDFSAMASMQAQGAKATEKGGEVSLSQSFFERVTGMKVTLEKNGQIVRIENPKGRVLRVFLAPDIEFTQEGRDLLTRTYTVPTNHPKYAEYQRILEAVNTGNVTGPLGMHIGRIEGQNIEPFDLIIMSKEGIMWTAAWDQMQEERAAMEEGRRPRNIIPFVAGRHFSHELWHHLEKFFLTNEEYAQVRDQYGKNPEGRADTFMMMTYEEAIKTPYQKIVAFGKATFISRVLSRKKAAVVKPGEKVMRGYAKRGIPERAPVSRDIGAAFSMAPQVAKEFDKLSDAQRGKPESAMLDLTMHIGGGPWGVLLEHVGDLTHRMSQKPEFFEGGREFVSEKVRRSLRLLKNPYGIDRETQETLASNANYHKIPLGEFLAKAKDLATKYSNAHRQLTVYNRPQWLAREAAIAIGERRWATAISHLEEIQGLLDAGSGAWEQEALAYNQDDKGDLSPYEVGAEATEPQFSMPPGRNVREMPTEQVRYSDREYYRSLPKSPNIELIADGETDFTLHYMLNGERIGHLDVERTSSINGFKVHNIGTDNAKGARNKGYALELLQEAARITEGPMRGLGSIPSQDSTFDRDGGEGFFVAAHRIRRDLIDKHRTRADYRRLGVNWDATEKRLSVRAGGRPDTSGVGLPAPPRGGTESVPRPTEEVRARVRGEQPERATPGVEPEPETGPQFSVVAGQPRLTGIAAKMADLGDRLPSIVFDHENVDRLAAIAEELDLNTVTENMANRAERELYQATQWHLQNVRKLPETVTVYRGGTAWDGSPITGVSLDKNVASRFGKQRKTQVYTYTIPRSSILHDVQAFAPHLMQESELIVRAADLTPVAEKLSDSGEIRFSVAPPIDSREFKQWFGSSKVVDEEGKPRVVYHGTSADFSVFRIPSWFSDSSSGAEHWAHQNALLERRETGERITPVFLRIVNPVKLPAMEFWKLNSSSVRKFRAQGYDGAIFHSQGGNTDYVPFSADQIKSATGNVGTYGQRPVTAEEAASVGMTEEEAASAQEQGDIRFSMSPNNPVKLSKREEALTKIGMLYGDEVTQRKRKSRSVIQVAAELQSRATRKYRGTLLQGDDPFLANPRMQRMLSRMIAAEIWEDLQREGHGKDWYTTAVRHALAVMNLMHPELKTDTRLRVAFRIALAISSQGVGVNQNVKIAEQQYRNFRDTGKFDESIGVGTSTEVMKQNWVKANALYAKMTPEEVEEFLAKQFTVRQLRDLGFDPPSGEGLDETVHGSYLFGAKIGNGFYQNLSGNYAPLTMDMWFMRSIGRLAGQLTDMDPERVLRYRNAFLNEVLRKKSDGTLVYAEQLEKLKPVWSEDHDQTVFTEENLAADDYVLLDFAQRIMAWWGKEIEAAKDNGTTLGPKPRAAHAARDYAKHLRPLDAPKGAEHRVNMRSIWTGALDILRANGIDLTMADAQATWWQPEKELYMKMGYWSPNAVRASYDTAIINFAKKQGVSNEAIKAAIAEADQASGGSVQGAVGAADQGGLRDLRGEREGVPREQQGDGSQAAGEEAPSFSVASRGPLKLSPEQQARWDKAASHGIRGTLEVVDPGVFRRMLEQNPGFPTLTQYTAQELAAPGKFRLYKIPGEDIAYGMKKTDEGWDVIGVINNATGLPAIATPSTMLHAIEHGATTLDAFDVGGFLPERYHRFGFKVTGSDKFDPSYWKDEPGRLEAAEEYWRTQGWKDGDPYPDVVYMRYTGGEDARSSARRDYRQTIVGANASGAGAGEEVGTAERGGAEPTEPIPGGRLPARYGDQATEAGRGRVPAAAGRPGTQVQGRGRQPALDSFQRTLAAKDKADLDKIMGELPPTPEITPEALASLYIPAGYRLPIDVTAEVMGRMDETRGGLASPDSKAALRRKLGDMGRSMRRTWKALNPNLSSAHAMTQELLRMINARQDGSEAEALVTVMDITADLDKEELQVFTEYIALKSILKDINDGKYVTHPEDVPFGFTHVNLASKDPKTARNDVENALKQLEGIIADPGNKALRAALAKRKAMVTALTERLVDAQLLPPQALDDPESYYHYQIKAVRDRIAREGYEPNVGIRRRGPRPGFLPYQRYRQGKGDPSLAYFQSEFEWLTHANWQLGVKESLEEIGRLWNKKAEIAALARQLNLSNLYGADLPKVQSLRVEMQDLLQTRPAGYTRRVKAIRAELKQLDPLWEEAKRIAIAKSKLRKALLGSSTRIPPKFAATVKAIVSRANSLSMPTAIPSDFWSFMSWLAANQHPAASEAAALTSAFAMRDQRMRELLNAKGYNYRTWADKELWPKDQELQIWEPKMGTPLYPVTTVDEKWLDQVLTNTTAPDTISKQALAEHVGKAQAMGGRTSQWLLPRDIAETLRDFIPDWEQSTPTISYMQGLWKQWVLMAPHRWLMYNLNNMSGDLDIVMSYAPSILRSQYTWRAMKDLTRWVKATRKAHGRMSPSDQKQYTWMVNQAVINSGESFGEVPELNNLNAFRRFMIGDPTTWQKIKSTYAEGGEVAGRYLPGVQTITVFRENVLRLASFYWFQDQIKKGNSVYGASTRSQVDAIKDPDERAAKLARELLGDYGAISEGGRWLRMKLMPFYSWIEINAPRYARMLGNSPYETGRMTGRLKPGTVKTLTAPPMLMLKAAQFYLLMLAFNNATPERKKMAQEFHRNNKDLHLVLGRGEDGEIIGVRFEGAFSDALEWFGKSAATLGQDLEDWSTGKYPIQDQIVDAAKSTVNRLAGAVTPWVKTPVEAATGLKLYPGPFKLKEPGWRLTYRKQTDYNPVLSALALDKMVRGLNTLMFWGGKGITGGEYTPNFFAPRATSPGFKLTDLTDQFITRSQDPGEVSYWERFAAAKAYERKVTGGTSGGGSDGDLGFYSYQFKRATQQNNEPVAAFWLGRYVEEWKSLPSPPGDSPEESILRSLANQSPDKFIKNQEIMKEFKISMGEDEKAIFEQAKQWYEANVSGIDSVIQKQFREKTREAADPKRVILEAIEAGERPGQARRRLLDEGYDLGKYESPVMFGKRWKELLSEKRSEKRSERKEAAAAERVFGATNDLSYWGR